MDMIFDAVDNDGNTSDIVYNTGNVVMNLGLKGFGEPSCMVLGSEDDMHSQMTIGCGHGRLLDHNL
jgi:hypothetical protein